MIKFKRNGKLFTRLKIKKKVVKLLRLKYILFHLKIFLHSNIFRKKVLPKKNEWVNNCSVISLFLEKKIILRENRVKIIQFNNTKKSHFGMPWITRLM